MSPESSGAENVEFRGELLEPMESQESGMRVVDYMVKHAESCEQIWASLETCLVHLSTDEASSSAGQGSATNPGFFPGIATFGKLATTARASALASIPGGPVSKMLDRMDDADKHSIGDLFFLVFGLSKADKTRCSSLTPTMRTPCASASSRRTLTSPRSLTRA